MYTFKGNIYKIYIFIFINLCIHHHRHLNLHGLYRLDIPSYLLYTGNLLAQNDVRTGVSTNANISSLQLLKKAYKLPSGATVSDYR